MQHSISERELEHMVELADMARDITKDRREIVLAVIPWDKPLDFYYGVYVASMNMYMLLIVAGQILVSLGAKDMLCVVAEHVINEIEKNKAAHPEYCGPLGE